MTKSEMIAKLDDIGGRIDSIQEDMKSLARQLVDLADELSTTYSLIEDLPTEASDIEEDEPLEKDNG